MLRIKDVFTFSTTNTRVSKGKDQMVNIHGPQKKENKIVGTGEALAKTTMALPKDISVINIRSGGGGGKKKNF